MNAYIRRFFKNLTIKTEFILVITMFALMPIIGLGLFYFFRMTALVQDKVYSYSYEIVRQISDYIDSIIDRTEIINSQLITIALDSEYLFYGGEKLNRGHAETINRIESLLHGFKDTFPVIENITLLGKDGQFITSAYNFDPHILMDKEWYSEARNVDLREIKFHIHKAKYANKEITDPPLVLSVFSKFSYYGNKSRTALILIDFNYDTVMEYIGNVNFGEGGVFTVVHNNGTILYHSDVTKAGKQIGELSDFENHWLLPEYSDKENSYKEDIMIRHELSEFGWVIWTIPESTLFGELRQVRNIFLFLTLSLCVITILFSFVVTNNITRPLYQLENALNKVQTGDFTIHIRETGNRDLRNLIQSYNIMRSEIIGLMDRVAMQEREKVKAELEALQAQVNPHFLYNTLDTIRGIAYGEGSKVVAEIADSLASLLRYSTSRKVHLVPLKDEIKHFNHYIQIQKYRFGNRFKIEYDIEQDLLDVLVLQFLLQPLVENCFKHGIENRTKQGIIRLRAKQNESDLIISVEDNGNGIEPDKLQSIQKQLSEVNGDNSNGIGLLNVNNRIRLFYGDKFGVDIDSTYGQGTVIIVRLPIEGQINGYS